MGDTLKVVSIEDAALDVFEMADSIQAYMLERDFALVQAKPGERLTVFHLGRIRTRAFTQWVQTAATEGERYMRAFQVACARVEHLVTPDGEGIELLTPEGRGTAGAPVTSYISDEQLDLIPPAYVEEIGAVAYQRGRLGKGSRAGYRPLPSSLTGWGQRIAWEARCRDAASTANEQPSQSSDAPQAPAQASHGGGESPTGATVEEATA